jgi:PadR family transcriptional regulator PadR
MNGEALKGHLELLLLAVLAEGPAHGYAVIEALRRRSGGLFDLPEGTIYPALHRLEAQGLLSSRWQEAAPRRRRVYELTARGRQALEKRQEEWRSFSEAVNATAGI